MKTLIIYHSGPHKNTQKIAEAISEVLEADLKKVVEIDPKIISGYELIGFGAGIYFGKHHSTLLNFVKNLPALNKKVFIFSTSGMAGKWFFHRQLRKELKERDCAIIGEFECRGFDDFGPFKFLNGVNKGRPNEKDLARTREFAVALKA